MTTDLKVTVDFIIFGINNAFCHFKNVELTPQYKRKSIPFLVNVSIFLRSDLLFVMEMMNRNL